MLSCFISYTAADSPWAEWVADVLRTAGHRVTVQAADFLPGDNFVLRMQEAASECDHTIVILSQNFLASRFGAAEWAAAFAQDPTGRKRKLIPISVDDVRPTGLWSSIIRLEISEMPEELAREEILRALAPLQKPPPAFPGAHGRTVDAPDSTGPRVDVWRLPASSANMVGRIIETESLTRSWLSGQDNIVAVTGWGGMGKTTLIANWLAEMARYRYHDADYVFAWSFDGQSDGEQWATSDQFFDTLIRFLGVTGAEFSTTWERCREATTRLQRSRAVLILDGLERLQNPPGPMEGTFRERVMQMFVRELAALNAGMLVVTSRLPVIDIDSYIGKTCRVLPIPELSRSESIEILRERGVVGDTAELNSLAGEVRDHPLSLRLLGGYLRTVFDGNARLWRESGLADVVASDGSNSSAIMDQYVSWFTDRPELQVLHLISLFNREATYEEFAALRGDPVVPMLNDLVAKMSRAEFAYSLGTLRNAGLIHTDSTDGTIDAHPLVREHFQQHFRKFAAAACQEGHRRLRNMLTSKAVELPHTLDECSSAISAIWHGTRAGDNASAYRDLYLTRLARDNHYLRDTLGAAASNYSVLTYILEGGEQELTRRECAQILGDQSLDLRMMGSTAEAVLPLRRAVEIARNESDHKGLANMLRHLSQLELAIGRVDQSCLHAEEAVETAGLPGLPKLESLSAHVSYSHSLLHSGRYAECIAVVRRSGILSQATIDDCAEYAERLTFYIALYRAGDALITVRRLSEFRADLRDLEPEIAEMCATLGGTTSKAQAVAAGFDRGPGPLANALADLLTVRLSMAAGRRDPADLAKLESAVDVVRQVGQRPWIIEANLVKSYAMRQFGFPDTALEAVRIAEKIASSDRMNLQLFACQLESAEVAAALAREEGGKTSFREISTGAARLGLALIEEFAVRLASAVDPEHR